MLRNTYPNQWLVPKHLNSTMWVRTQDAPKCVSYRHTVTRYLHLLFDKKTWLHGSLIKESNTHNWMYACRSQTRTSNQMLQLVPRENRTYFLTPQTHVLMWQYAQVSCNFFAPAMYLLRDSWYKSMPKPVYRLASPTVIKPMTWPTWKYVSPDLLATSEIYTDDNDLDELRDHIMILAKRPAVLNTVAKSLMGQPTTI